MLIVGVYITWDLLAATITSSAFALIGPPDLEIRCRKVLEGLDFGWVWLHALCSKYSTIEGYLRLPDPTL